MAVCQNLVPLVNIKIAKKMVLIGIDPSPNLASGSWDWKIFSLRAMMACLWSPVTVAPTQTWRRRQRSDPGNLIILKKNIAIKIVDIVDELIIDISWWIYSTGKKGGLMKTETGKPLGSPLSPSFSMQETCEELKRIAEKADEILLQTLRDIEDDQMLLGCVQRLLAAMPSTDSQIGAQKSHWYL